MASAKMKRVWLSFDLGIDGDYDGIYAMLDEFASVECGDSTASFQFDVGTREPAAALLSVIRKRGIRLRAKDRLYLIWRRENGSVTGRFVAGSRRRAPWAGYAVQTSEETEDASD